MRSERPADSTTRRWAARAFRHLCTAAAAAAWLALVPSGTLAAEPTGIGEARFGMSVAAVRKLYPKLAPASDSPGTPAPGETDVTRYVLRDTADLGLPKPVDAEMRFWRDRLSVIVVSLRDNDPAAALAALTAQIGPPQTGPAGSSWKGEKVTVVLRPASKFYSYNDNAIKEEARQAFIKALKEARERGESTPFDVFYRNKDARVLRGTPSPAP